MSLRSRLAAIGLATASAATGHAAPLPCYWVYAPDPNYLVCVCPPVCPEPVCDSLPGIDRDPRVHQLLYTVGNATGVWTSFAPVTPQPYEWCDQEGEVVYIGPPPQQPPPPPGG